MVKAKLVLEDGLLKSCVIQGHAGAGRKGTDIVCAAVSVLARTAFHVLSEREGITVKGEFPERGEFSFEITALNAQNSEFLAGVGTFLAQGLLSVSKEYPNFCRLSIKEC